MIKEILQSSGIEIFAEISLLMFFGIFVAVTVRALWSDRHTMQDHARIAIQDALRDEEATR